LSILTKDLHVYEFSFDRNTHFERDSAPFRISDAHSGDWIEIAGDRGASPSLGYARSVRVLDRRSLAPAAPRTHIDWPNHDPTEALVPRGDLTLAGLVVRVSPGQLVLRLRAGEERSVSLRSDTVYLENGTEVDAASLRVNTHVFIRAGSGLDGQPEAYRVIWAGILMPPAE